MLEGCSWSSQCFIAFRRIGVLFSLYLSRSSKTLTLLKRFLWSGTDLKKFGAKVAWEDVCSPKEGNLRIKNVYVWNKACMVRHLWDITRKKDSVAEMVSYVPVKGKESMGR